MKIFVNKDDFSEELKLFQGVFEKKSLIDILQNIKISAFENNQLELVATDLEIGLTSTINCKVDDPGSFTVNGKDLYNIVSKMPEGSIEISENNDLSIFITNMDKTCRFRLSGLQSADYPNLPKSDFSNFIELDTVKFRSMINKCYYIISPEIKFNVGGAILNINGKKVELVATDSHRLSYTYFSADENISEEDANFIISRKTLLELLKIGESKLIKFDYDKNNLFFKSNNRILSARIIDQKFPDYRTVIPVETKSKIIINTKSLLDSLKRILVFRTRNDAVFFKFAKNMLILERTSSDKGDAHDEINIEFDEAPLDVAFNGNFIFDFLTHIEEEQVEIDMNDRESSFVFKPVGHTGDGIVNFIYVVMPLNI